MDLFGEVSGAKPFLKWAGGKRQLLAEIERALPAHFASSIDTYIEPFIGGGAVLFWIMQKYPNIKRAIINDINKDLAYAYEVIRHEPESLIKLLSEMQSQYYSLKNEAARRIYFDEHRAEFNLRKSDWLRNTALVVLLNRTCFNGLYRVNSKNKFNVPFGKYERPLICDPTAIRANSALLQRVTILHGDFADVMPQVSPNSFLYFDPPYKPISISASFNSYASDGFGDAAQERLAEFCKQLDRDGHKWLLSNSDLKNADPANQYFDILYAGFNIRRIDAGRNINSDGAARGKIKELLVSNYYDDLGTALDGSFSPRSLSGMVLK